MVIWLFGSAACVTEEAVTTKPQSVAATKRNCLNFMDVSPLVIADGLLDLVSAPLRYWLMSSFEVESLLLALTSRQSTNFGDGPYTFHRNAGLPIKYPSP